MDAYVFLVQAQASGLVFRREAAARALLDEGLPRRNDASLRYRFRNISAIVQELGGPLLIGYSPAQQVGAGVRERIRAMLLANVHFNELVAADRIGRLATDTPSVPRADALAALAKLRRQIDEVEREFTGVRGIGHNNPPGPIAPVDDRRVAFEAARADIATLESELAKPAVDQQIVTRHSEGLLKFGVQMTTWIGQRTTKFVDAFLVALAPAVVLKVTGLMPQIIEALSTVAKSIGH
ncbi:hypothetical protein [Methylobacterium gregans]|uniref:hypothetical protein n=1 Tax=Methylobacterium gregans TaxID=374424 RepID=UPI001EE2FF9A|nr:hypothetical protein [Methylobacterium gregans]MDQ0523777.1 hypothetical protein [Methylobacterium gregans]